MAKKRLVIGLTGSFGSGKSTVGRILKRLGAKRVIDTDRLAHEVFRPNHQIGKKVKSLFNIKGSFSRKAVAKEVFSNPRKRKQLEALVHPYVYRRVRSELKRIRQGIVVLAGAQNIEKRLKHSGFKPKEVRLRLKAQLPEPEKKRRSDYYILNTGSKNSLIQKTKLIWEKLTANPSLRAKRSNLRDCFVVPYGTPRNDD